MKRITLPCGETVAALGQGTWNIGDDPKRRADEIASLRRGLDLGLTLIDTAEMYGEGRSEQLVGEAVKGRRDGVFIVSKVYPHNASKRAMPASCEASLKRLGTDRIDLYLLHWPGSVPLAETVQAFELLQREGKIRHWGVSNFDLRKMKSLHALAGGAAVQTNQVLYHLGERGIEWDLVPWQREHGVPVMAYSPTDQGRLLRDPGLSAFALRTGRTPAQVALAWLLAREAIVIPKTSHPDRVQENATALDKPLTPDELHELDALFPPPDEASSLAML